MELPGDTPTKAALGNLGRKVLRDTIKEQLATKGRELRFTNQFEAGPDGRDVQRLEAEPPITDPTEAVAVAAAIDAVWQEKAQTFFGEPIIPLLDTFVPRQAGVDADS